MERLALASWFGHRVDRYSSVDPTGIIALEEMVREGGEDEIVRSQHVPFEALRPQRMKIVLQDAPDKELGQRLAVEVLEEPADRIDQRGSKDLRRTDPIEDESPAVGQVERFGQQLP